MAYVTCVITLFSGPVHSGKSTRLKEVCAVFERNGSSFDGYLSEAVFDGDRRTGYDILDLQTGARTPFFRLWTGRCLDHVGRFGLLAAGLSAAEGIIRRGRSSPLLIVDELGPLELDGRGIWPALAPVVLGSPGTDVLAVVRRGLVAEFLKLLGPQTRVFDISARPAPELAAALASRPSAGAD